MPEPQILSAADQMTGYVRDELPKRRWNRDETTFLFLR
jgi:hypothetical protein